MKIQVDTWGFEVISSKHLVGKCVINGRHSMGGWGVGEGRGIKAGGVWGRGSKGGQRGL